MKPLHAFLFAAVFMGIAPNLSPLVLGENRPYGELNYLQQLNGEQTRLMNPASTGADGGGLTLWSIDGGPGCNDVPTGGVYEIHCNAAGRFCPWGSDGGSAGGFCNILINSVGYGRPVAASSASSPAPFFYTAPPGTTGSTKNICIVPEASATMTCAVFQLR